jgi:hypothetical protein
LMVTQHVIEHKAFGVALRPNTELVV